jgi:hypothetical protein
VVGIVPQLVAEAALALVVALVCVLAVAVACVLAGADELAVELDEQAARPRPAVRARAAAAAPPVVTALIYVSFDWWRD